MLSGEKAMAEFVQKSRNRDEPLSKAKPGRRELLLRYVSNKMSGPVVG